MKADKRLRKDAEAGEKRIKVAEMKPKRKLPKIDLKELARDKRQNKKERLKFLEYYAKRIREGTA